MIGELANYIIAPLPDAIVISYDAGGLTGFGHIIDDALDLDDLYDADADVYINERLSNQEIIAGSLREQMVNDRIDFIMMEALTDRKE